MLSASAFGSADNTYRDLDYLGYHKNRILQLFYYTLFGRKQRQTHSRKEPELILLLEIMHCARNLPISQLSASRQLINL